MFSSVAISKRLLSDVVMIDCELINNFSPILYLSKQGIHEVFTDYVKKHGKVVGYVKKNDFFFVRHA